jgi:LDH2 family malate/lactate/ureidoglycolate dehydrogenase
MYHKAEKPLHDGWALDENGKPCNDAGRVLKNISAKKGGGIMPLGRNEEYSGSHKGYGYGMISEIFTSILSMGLTSNHTHIDGKGGTCHGFIAIDPACFEDPQEIREHLSVFLQELRDAPKAEGQDWIYTHGEKEHFAVERVQEQGVAVDMKTVIEMMQLANDLQIDFSDFFGDIHPDEKYYASLY